jgi:hypothetical protein
MTPAWKGPGDKPGPKTVPVPHHHRERPKSSVAQHWTPVQPLVPYRRGNQLIHRMDDAYVQPVVGMHQSLARM